MNELFYPHSEEQETYPIYELPGFLTDEEIKFFRDYIDQVNFRQKILADSKIAKVIEAKVRQHNFPDAGTFYGCSKEITVSKHVAPFHIATHKDNRKDEGRKKNLKKLFVYLDEDEETPDSGGTIFLDKNRKPVATIKRERGKACLFDIRQLHKGQKLVKGTKYLIGTRLLYS
jgi:hypothetical protein